MDGVVRSIVDFRKKLEARGHEVFIFAPGDRKTKRNNKDPHVFYSTSVPFLPYPNYKLALFPFTKEFTLRKLGVDIIHTHGMATMGLFALAMSRAHGLPLVGTFHTMIPKATEYVIKSERMTRVAERTAWRYLISYYSKCDVVIAPSDEIKKELKRKGIKKVYTVPNGVDRKRFNENIDGRGIRRRYGTPLFVYVGRLGFEKDIPSLIRAMPFVFGDMKNARLLVVGDGPAMTECKRVAKESDVADRVFFTGFVPEKQLPKYYAAADVFVSPSSFETEGLCVLEAMSCGKPAVGVNEGGVKYLIKNGFNGYLVKPGRPRLLADAMIKAYVNRNNLTKNCISTAERFSLENCVEKLLRVYERVVK